MKSNERLYLDMDGTLADFYGYTDWKAALDPTRWTPEIVRDFFMNLRPMLSQHDILTYAQHYSEIIVLSMTPWYAPHDIQRATIEGKMKWMHMHFPEVTNIVILPHCDTKNDTRNALVDTCPFNSTPRWEDHLIDDNPHFLLNFTGSAETPPWVSDLYWLDEL